jgi:hypothetical protein
MYCTRHGLFGFAVGHSAQVFLRFAKNQIDEETHETPDLHQQLSKQASWAPSPQP